LDFHTHLCVVKLGETSHGVLQRVVDGANIDNLIVVIMEALQNGGGLSSIVVAEKLFCFWG
jgi:hypothetical protein